MPGAGNSSSSQQQQQQSQSSPWAPTQPLLQSMISQLSGMSPSLTGTQQTAANTLNTEAGSVPSFAAPASTGVTGLLNGGGATTYSPMLQTAYNTLGTSLSPLTNPNNLNPMSNPYLGQALSTMNNDITNQVNDAFAASGNFGTPQNATALARGLSQGEGGLLTGQYNTNVGNLQNAANTLYGAGNTTATGLTGFNQLGNTNILSGIQGAGAIPALTTAPGATALSAANTTAQQPFTNMGWLSSLIDPMAALGSQSSGTSTSTGTATQPFAQTFSQFGSGLNNIGNFLWSDERLKEDIEPVGMLFDSTPVYSYRYRGDDTPQIGVLAQDVEKRRPDAVVEFGPARIKAVDYSKATERSRVIGGWLDSNMAMAA